MRDYAKQDRAAFIAGVVRTITDEERAALVRAQREQRVEALKAAMGAAYLLHPANRVQRRV